MQLPRRQRLLLSIGCLLATSSAFIHLQFPAVPDFFIGLASGTGLGMIVGVLIWQKKKQRMCSREA